MAYGFKYKVTVDNTKVSGSSNLSNFPMLFSGTYDGTGGEPDLRTTGNGGDIENTDSSGGADGATTVPADFEFSSDEAGSTPLDFEVENYNASTGEIQAWVEIPTLSHDIDTDIYLHYGDSGVTTSQEDVAGTWNSNYKAVWHLNQSSGTRHDSTANGNDLSDNNTVTGATGQIDGASNFESSNSEYLDVADNASLDITADLTLQAWINPASSTTGGNINKSTSNDAFSTITYFLVFRSDDKMNFGIASGSDGDNVLSTSTVSTMTKVTGVYVPSTSLTIYINGSQDNQNTSSIDGSIKSSSDPLQVGFDGDNRYFDGIIDEARVLATSISGDWDATEYNNQNSPSTFYTISDLATGIASLRQLVGTGQGTR